MSWSRNPNEASESPNTYFHCEKTSEEGVRSDSREVFNEVIQRKETDKVPDDALVLFTVNSVNSFVDVSWTDQEFEAAGVWCFTLWLLKLGEACLDHEDGADEFVRICKFAFYDMVYDYYYDTYGDEFETMVCKPLCYFFVPEYHEKPEYIIM